MCEVYAINLRNMIDDIRDDAINLCDKIANMLAEYDMASVTFHEETNLEFSEELFEDYFGYVLAMEQLTHKIEDEVI